MLEQTEWSEHELGDLFEKLTLKFNKKPFDKINDISKDQNKEFDLPLVNAKFGDNGIMYYGRSSDFDSVEMTIDIVNDGAISTGKVYPQPQRTGVLYNAYLIKPKNVVTRNQLIFFSKCIEKSIQLKYGYENKAGWEKVKKEKIKLPQKEGKIDYQFMENFIAELEQARIAELEAYLIATGLNDYELTNDEKKALEEIKNIKWAEYRMEKLFTKVKTQKLSYNANDLPKVATAKYILPCLTSSFQNQGLNYFVPKDEATILNNVISIPSNSDVYRAYFQSRNFTILSDAYAIKWKNEEKVFLPNHYIFSITSINKVTDLPIYSYKNKLGGWSVVKNKYIQLPVKNSEIDYEFMTNFISAIKKLVIKDVVLYANAKIEATKKVAREGFYE